MKKNIFKIILIIIVLLVVTFVIYIVRNYLIISKIVDTQNKIKNSTNYSLSFSISENGQVKNNGTYSYKDGRSVGTGLQEGINWHDNNTNENIIYNPENLTAKVSSNDMNFLYTEISELIIISNKLKMAFECSISSKDIEGQKCYVLKPIIGITSNTYYYNANDKTLRRIETSSGKNVIDYSDWSFGTVQNEDISRPDLEGYNIQ